VYITTLLKAKGQYPPKAGLSITSENVWQGCKES